MRHKWTIRDRDTHTERYECKCGWTKTVISPSDGFPESIYVKDGQRLNRAPPCEGMKASGLECAM
jgi:hypothetical protein